MPINRVEELALKHLKKDDKIVVYCIGYSYKASTKVSIKLMEMRYKDVYDFKAGKSGWKRADLKLEGEIK